MAKLYEITSDLTGLYALLENAVDEDGNERELTSEEMETMKEWFEVSADEFKTKFDHYCKFIKNLKVSAANADDERKNYKSELDRLSKRSKSFENKSKAVQSMLQWCMEKLQMKNFKSDLFSAGVRPGKLVVKPLDGFDFSKTEDELLKPREVDTKKVSDLMNDGEIITKEGDENYGKLFWKISDKEIPGIKWAKGEFLVIR